MPDDRIVEGPPTAERRRSLDTPRGEGVAMSLAGGYVKRFFSPSEYESGRRAGVWACLYLTVTLVVIASSDVDANSDDQANLLAYLATAPLSFFVHAQGARMFVALAVCALVNAFVFWVIFRGSSHYPRRPRAFRP
jgi:hypothetical protein